MVKYKFRVGMDATAWILTVIMFSAFFILMKQSYGKIIYLMCAIGLVSLSVIKNKGKLHLKMSMFIAILILNVFLYIVSSTWAWNPDYSITAARTVLMSGIYLYSVYLYYKDEKSTIPLLFCIVCSALIVSIYTIIFFGIDNIIMTIMTGKRLTNDFININSIGLLCSMGIIICLSRFLYRKKFAWIIITIPLWITWTATGSKKAMVMVVVGMVLYYFIAIVGKFNKKSIFKIIAFFIIAMAIYYIFTNINFFAAFVQRVEQYINAVLHKTELTTSDALRQEMIKVGWLQFKKTPILGIGAGNSVYLNSSIMGKEVYLHNCYIDTLVNLGIVGFIVYYLYYIIPIKNLFKYRQNDPTGICFVILVISLIMDYGMVSTFDRETYFYIMLIHLQSEMVSGNRTEYFVDVMNGKSE